MERYDPWIEQALPYVISFGVGLLIATVTTTWLTLFGWRRGWSFYVTPPFSLFSPFITVTWENARKGDLLMVLNIILCALALGLSYLLLESVFLTVAAGVGVLLVLFKPYTGNIVIGIIDRYEIEPKKRVRSEVGDGGTSGRGSYGGSGNGDRTTSREPSSTASGGGSSNGGWRSRGGP